MGSMMNIRRNIMVNTPHLTTITGTKPNFTNGVYAPISFTAQIEPKIITTSNIVPPGVAGTYTSTEGNLTVQTSGDGIYTLTGTTGDAGELVVVSLIDSYTVPYYAGHYWCLLNSQGSNMVYLKLYDSNDEEIDYWTCSPQYRVADIYSTMTESTVYKFGFEVLANTTVNMTIAPMLISTNDSTESYIRYNGFHPAEGWTQAQIIQLGSNIFDDSTLVRGTFSGTGEELDTYTTRCRSGFIQVYPGVTYYVGLYNEYMNQQIYELHYYDGSQTWITYEAFNSKSLQKTIPAGCHFIKVLLRYSTNIETTTSDWTGKVQVNKIKTQTYSFPQLAGTVYGGSLTVNTDGTGTLTVTDDVIASYNGETLPSTWISDRDTYAANTTPTTGAQVVYKLASPVTYNLSNLNVIKTFAGQNTIYSNTGSISLSYWAR